MNEESVPTAELPDARRWAMLCHIMALTGLLANGIGFILGPLILWLLKKEDHPFVNEQGREAINFQITMLIVVIIGALLALFLIGFVIMAAAGLMMVIFPVIGAVRANDGQHYRYPLTLRLL